ncbi:unnamed protein product [Rotaria socialis]|uniref:Uncharacterized protein n=1 Tax=Rotaria socialis TaxID=392032 RepID=A0A821DXT4_9BILA|nr:unnamed protein product [Rotaria socialis]CAF3353137.1 unnamed protein product [Rotaria socialis]CAF3436298.1 unnamed protein product [Rotaria socialis]CAF3587354.1 unnamed protein product [Rotaria socialis]CAF4438281.1 unnamed protein product [Rotaria socialis]
MDFDSARLTKKDLDSACLTKKNFVDVIEALQANAYWFHEFSYNFELDSAGYVITFSVTRRMAAGAQVALVIGTIGSIMLTSYLAPLVISNVKDLLEFALKMLGTDAVQKLLPILFT